MQRVFPQTRAVLLEPVLDLLGDSAFDPDAGPVVEIPGFRALEPHELAICSFLGHGSRSRELLDDLGHDA